MLQVPPALLCLPARAPLEPRPSPLPSRVPPPGVACVPGLLQRGLPPLRVVALRQPVLLRDEHCGQAACRGGNQNAGWEQEQEVKWKRTGAMGATGRIPSSVPTKPLTSPPVEKQGRQGLKPQGGLARGQVGRRETPPSLPFSLECHTGSSLTGAQACPLGWMQDRAHSRVHTPPGPSSTDRCRELSDTICPRGCTDTTPSLSQVLRQADQRHLRPQVGAGPGRKVAREAGAEQGSTRARAGICLTL